MSDIPEGAQRSEDGNYWWDGTDWQPVEGAQAGGGGGAGTEQAGGGGGGEAIAQALAQQGITVDPATVSDPQKVARVVQKVESWYSGLDATSKAIVDTLTQQGMAPLLADPEVGVVEEDGADLLAALGGTGQPLGTTLVAANEATQQAGGGGTAYT